MKRILAIICIFTCLLWINDAVGAGDNEHHGHGHSHRHGHSEEVYVPPSQEKLDQIDTLGTSIDLEIKNLQDLIRSKSSIFAVNQKIKLLSINMNTYIQEADQALNPKFHPEYDKLVERAIEHMDNLQKYGRSGRLSKIQEEFPHTVDTWGGLTDYYTKMVEKPR